MMSPASSLHPRLGERGTPVSIFRTAIGAIEISGTLGLSIDEMDPVGDHLLSAKIDVPPGEWLLWQQHGFAMWIGERVDALPAPVRRRVEHGGTDDISCLLNALADIGVWLREAALLVEGTWTPSRRPNLVLPELATGAVSAMSGIFVDSAGRSARLEMTRGTVCWTDHPMLAIQWLLTAVDLPAPQ